jgi:hypothetical protein
MFPPCDLPMSTMFRSLLPLASAALLAAPLSSQIGPSEGSRVRATVPTVSEHRLVGVVSSATIDSLILSTNHGSTMVRLGKPTIQSLQVSRGHARGTWALIGAGVGFLAGGVLGGASGADDDVTGGLGAMAGFVAGVVVGVPLGAIGGAVLAPERWVDYPLPRQE